MGSDYPLVSVIILNLNGQNFLKRCLHSVFSSDYTNFEVIVVDNASTDGSVDFVKSNYPIVKIVQNPRNYGYAKGNNEGAKVSQGKYIIFLNNDTEVDANWLKELVKVIDNYPTVGICGGKILALSNRNIILSAGGEIFLPIMLYGERGIFEEDVGQYSIYEPVLSVSGAALMIRKDLFKKLGGFDERYVAYCEEVDLCWRVRLSGFEVIYTPKAKIFHKLGGTASWLNPQRRFFSRRNMIATLMKNLSFKNQIFLFPTFLLFSIMESLFLSLFNTRNMVALMVKAIAWNISQLSVTLALRENVQKTRCINDSEVFRLMRFNIANLIFELSRKRFFGSI